MKKKDKSGLIIGHFATAALKERERGEKQKKI